MVAANESAHWWLTAPDGFVTIAVRSKSPTRRPGILGSISLFGDPSTSGPEATRPAA
jgi:hypothetical protein